MNHYTVVFNHHDDNTLEFVHINTKSTRFVHLMFFGKLANEWGYGWDDIRFGQPTGLDLSHGTIMIHDRPLHYDILSGHHKSGSDLAMLTGRSCG